MMNEEVKIDATDASESVQNEPLKVEASLSEWEEMMVEELSQKFGIADDIVLEIGLTFVMNEMSAAMNGKPSIINSINPGVAQTDNKSE